MFKLGESTCISSWSNGSFKLIRNLRGTVKVVLVLGGWSPSNAQSSYDGGICLPVIRVRHQRTGRGFLSPEETVQSFNFQKSNDQESCGVRPGFCFWPRTMSEPPQKIRRLLSSRPCGAPESLAGASSLAHLERSIHDSQIINESPIQRPDRNAANPQRWSSSILDVVHRLRTGIQQSHGLVFRDWTVTR